MNPQQRKKIEAALEADDLRGADCELIRALAAVNRRHPLYKDCITLAVRLAELPSPSVGKHHH
ncbi:MAG: hypothetical protein AB1705_27400 [Verrucomicrobiota bacterium]